MPSPVGHLIAGAAVAWTADAIAPARDTRPPAQEATALDRAGGLLTVACAALAALPDIDLLTGGHRTMTHSIGATILVAAIAAIVGRAFGRSALRIGLVCGLAYGSHVLLDWLAVDIWGPRGIRALWPFSDAWYISGWDVFLQTERRHMFSVDTMMINLRAVAREIEILVPIAALAWYARRARTRRTPLVAVKPVPRFATELPGGDHAAE